MTGNGSHMTANNFFISVDDHVQEHPEVWTKRLSRSKWGDRIPHLAKNSDGVERWVVDGREIPLAGVADCGAAMPDRTVNPQYWADVPTSIYDPKERLKVMDGAGIDYAVLYPTVAGSIWRSAPQEADIGAGNIALPEKKNALPVGSILT